MKKLLLVLTVAGVMTACKSKKADEKKPEETTTTTATEPAKTTTTETPTAAVPDVPTFADAEVQKFVNEYSAFVTSYKKGIVDPAQVQELQKTAQEWSTKMVPVAMKLASHPEELKKWQAWAMALANEMKGVVK